MPLERLLVPTEPLWALILRPLGVFVVLLALLRLTGKREIGELTPGDFLTLLILSESIQGAITGGDNSLTGGLVAAATLFAANWLLNLLAFRSPTVERLVHGTPTLLMHNGQLLWRNLEKEKITLNELLSQLREQNIFDLAEVETIILESDGRLSVRRWNNAGSERIDRRRRRV